MGEEEKKVEAVKTEDPKVEEKKTEEKVVQPQVDVDAKVQAGIDAARRKSDEDKVHDQVGHLRRTNPEGYKKVMEKFGADGGGSEELAEAQKRIEKLELERARERALRSHKLDDDDEQFLTAMTAEGIESQAAALAARAEKLKASGNGAGDRAGDQNDGESGKVELPVYDKKSGVTEEDYWDGELERTSR